MKEQKELIEAALKLANELAEFTDDEYLFSESEMELVRAAQIYQAAQEQLTATDVKNNIEEGLARHHDEHKKEWDKFMEPFNPLFDKALSICKNQSKESERRKAPWKDSEGNELFEGDVIRISNGEELIVFCHDTREIWGAKDNKNGEILSLFMIGAFKAVKVSK